jgi:antitoxin HicB
MRYKVNLEVAQEGGWFVSFPDIPEALTQGDSREEALAMAQDALVTAFDFYFEDGRQIPAPASIQRDDNWVDVPASVAAKVILLNAMLEAEISQADLARRLRTRPQEVSRIVNLAHPTKIDTIERALGALGLRLELSATPG